MLFEALFFQLGYNATLVTFGATLLGVAAGVTGSFLFFRKRALVSDAISHATLPGVALAFIVMVALGFDGRSLPASSLDQPYVPRLASSLSNGLRRARASPKTPPSARSCRFSSASASSC